MADIIVAVDETGNFDFSRSRGATKYLILCSIKSDSFDFVDKLLALRRELALAGIHLEHGFHASQNPQAVRDRVFGVIAGLGVRADATIFEKSKAQGHLRTPVRLYKMAWYLHFGWLAPRVVSHDDRLLALAASLKTKAQKGAFLQAVQDVVNQAAPCREYRVAFWDAASEPCLWVADYVAWAVQRKWEAGDSRSYDLVSHLFPRPPFDIWQRGTKHYY